MVKNYGVSFGYEFNGMEVVVGLLLAAVGWWYIKSKNWRLLFILAGGGLNWWQRLRWGYVKDYWRIPGTSIYNNVNDWLIAVGVILCLWQILKKKTLK